MKLAENSYRTFLSSSLTLLRDLYYYFRHVINSIKLPNSDRYYSLERKVERMPADDAISLLKTHFLNVEKQLSKKSKLRVGFCVYSSSEWQCEKIYRYMEDDPRFDPVIVICGLNTGNAELTWRTYEETCKFFVANAKYSVDYFGIERHSSLECKIDDYDILFYFQLSNNYLPEPVNFPYRLQSQLMVFVLYGYKQTISKDAYVIRNYLSVDMLQSFWMHFCTNRPEYETRAEMRLKAYNALITGLPKIDDLLDGSFEEYNALWKVSSSTKYKIIWAPHFNMENNMNGTFHENYNWFYEFARAHSEYSWIVRPHPRMLKGALRKGVFSSPAEYDEYMDKWARLPNAKVVPFGDYYGYFATSDAMITDCMSFISEYMHTNNPLLVLMPINPRQVNHDVERLLNEGCYRARGNAFLDIRGFLETTVADDPMAISRKQICAELLDFRNKLGMSTSKYIYNFICKRIFSK